MYVNLNNSFYTTNTPLVFVAGQPYKVPNYNRNYLTKLTNDQFTIFNYANYNLQEISKNILSTPSENSYSVQAMFSSGSAPFIFNFYVYKSLYFITQDTLYSALIRMLPPIYKSTNKLNNADNFGTSVVLGEVANYVDRIYFAYIKSIGANGYYSEDFENVYIGFQGYLRNAAYPVQFLDTLSKINSQYPTKYNALARLISTLLFQYVGLTTYNGFNVGVPVSVRATYTTPTTDDPKPKLILDIKIYLNQTTGDLWILGDSQYSELNRSTILRTPTSSKTLYFIYLLIDKLVPSHINYTISLLTMDDFSNHYYYPEVINNNYFIDPAYINTYNAFMVINNDKEFNTRGFFFNYRGDENARFNTSTK